MFVDEASITVVGGDGGDGCLSFRREKFVPRGGPDGGDGGHGGSIILVADPGQSTLLPFRYRRLFRAPRGRHGQGSNKTGRSGEDLVVAVPVGTVILDEDGVRILADLREAGQRFVAARGGHGGRGNARFATSTNRAPRRQEPGRPGEIHVLRVELKLLADVGLLGFPNAGKSTLISRISAARPKIADYPFTTLVPNLGVVDCGDYRSFVAADIPGLVEGAHRGAGLGDRFLRHLERCRLLLHLVDATATERDPVEGIAILNRELASYRPDLANKPQILVLTKADAAQDPGPSDRVQRHASDNDVQCIVISSVTGLGIDKLVRTVATELDRLRDAEPNRDARRPVVAVLGGTFDPIHAGHVHLAEEVIRTVRPERLLVVLAALPPHKNAEELTAVTHREAMVRLALADHPAIEVSTLETDPGQVSYTIDTLRALRKADPGCDPVFVLGLDALLEITTWRDYDRLLGEFDLIAVARPGCDLDSVRDRLPPDVAARFVPVATGDEDDPLTTFSVGRGGRIFHLLIRPLAASSSEIRRRAAAGEDPGDLVAPAVARYIRDMGLYAREEDR